MHSLARLHSGPHLYGPGGIGHVEFDPTTLLTSETIVETRDLPGFVERNVTYESHHFWIHFLRPSSHLHAPRNEREAEERKRFSAVLIRVNHGGGWEVWRGDYMLADALLRYGADDRGAFLLCWYLLDNAKQAREAGRAEAAAEYRLAFVDGRLRKRKLPARGQVKVWIEPPTETKASA